MTCKIRVKEQKRAELEFLRRWSRSERKESSCCEEESTEGGRVDPARSNSETGGFRLYQGCGQHFPGSLARIEECNGAAKKKALSATTPDVSALALVHPGRAGGEVRTFLDSVQPNVCKRKAEELPNQD
jgi:hypothetical protein